MSFGEFKQKPISSKVVLVEFGSSDPHSFFLNAEPGIWRYDYFVNADTEYSYQNGAFCYGCHQQACSGPVGNGKPSAQIISVIVNGSLYSEVTSMANLRSTDESFLWETGQGVLYIHFNGFQPPWAFSTILLGVQINIANKAGHYEGMLYESRLRDCAPLAVETDPMYYGVLGYGGGEIQIRNEDGAYDHIVALKLYGQVIKILYGEEEAPYSEFRLQYSGLIEEFWLDYETLNLQVNDKRKRLSRSVPPNIFDTVSYPYIKAENANRRIPLAYGYCDNVPVICTNEDETSPSYYHFKLCDTAFHGIQGIDAVCVEGVEKIPVNVSLANATFDLPPADYSPDDEVTADLRGYESGGSLIENALEVVKDLLASYANIAYTSDNYDQAEFAAALASAPNIQIFVPESTAIETIVGQICQSLNGILFAKANGKFTFRYLHRVTSVLESIPKEEFLSKPKLSFPNNQFASTVVIGYDHDYSENVDLLHVDASQEANMVNTYGISRRHEIQTLLNSLADAEALATNMLAEYAQIPEMVEVDVPISHIELELLDDLTIEINRAHETWLGSITMRVYGITKDLLRGALNFVLRRRD